MSETLHPEETVTSFLLLRHGETKATEEGKLYNDPNAPLTEKGEAQANALADWLSTQKFDRLLSSSAKRVTSTAKIVADKVAHSPIIVDGLDEWRIGNWEGRTYLDLKKNEPDEYQRWSADPIHKAPPGGESIKQLIFRVSGRVKELVAEHQGKRLVLVTHAGVIRSFLVTALGIPAENFWRLSVPTGSVAKVDLSANFATVHFTGFRPQI